MNTSIRSRRPRGAAISLLVLLALAVTPAVASAAAPVITPQDPTNITTTSATVRAKVESPGLTATCRVEFSVNGAFDKSVPCRFSLIGTFPGIGDIKDLAPNTTYPYRFVVRNADGTTVGPVSTFTTRADPPAVRLIQVNQITQTTAFAQARVNPNGTVVTSCRIEYGTTSQFGSSVPCNQSIGSGTSEVSVNGNLAGLEPGTVYHARVVATNAGGTSASSELTFTTVPLPPTIEGVQVVDITRNSATVKATVTSLGLSSTCVVGFGLKPDTYDAVQCDPFEVLGTQQVTAHLTNLLPDTQYRYQFFLLGIGVDAHTEILEFNTLP